MLFINISLNLTAFYLHFHNHNLFYIIFYREVYGQIAKDIEDNPIDWEVEYKLGFKGRPSPSDFPAFAHEKDNKNSKEV